MVGGISGGYSSEPVFHLCGEGYFKQIDNSSMVAGGDGLSPYSQNSNRDVGTWQIELGTDDNPVLLLRYNNGNVALITLTYEN